MSRKLVYSDGKYNPRPGNSRTARRPPRRDKAYTESDLALFSQYIERRASHRPQQCHRGEKCWVAEGPPAFKFGSATNASASICSGCGGTILASK